MDPCIRDGAGKGVFTGAAEWAAWKKEVLIARQELH
jgi:hypothetical protein